MTTEKRKIALVIGAANTLGRTIALALAQHGWDLAVHYNRSADEVLTTIREIEALGRRALALQCELADEQAVRALLPQAAEALGCVNCVVNNASLFAGEDGADFSLAKLDAHMHVNLAAPVLLAQALHAATPDGEQGVVVNLLDQKLFDLSPDYLSYTLSQAALRTATTILAQALAPKVRMVGVVPGIMPEGFANAHSKILPGRSGTPEDVATTICFVAENSTITGTTILVDGGQHLIPLQHDVMSIAQ